LTLAARYRPFTPDDPFAQNAGVNRTVKLRILFIAILIALVFIGYLSLVDRPGRRTYEAYVALHGQEPFGPINRPTPDPPGTVVLYRFGRGGVTCFDVFHSEELREVLSSKDGKRATMEYDTFTHFGKVRAYNVHSVDGIVLANGSHVLHADFAAIAGVAGPAGSDTGSKDACW
jgi:hypothetical protein